MKISAGLLGFAIRFPCGHGRAVAAKIRLGENAEPEIFKSQLIAKVDDAVAKAASHRCRIVKHAVVRRRLIKRKSRCGCYTCRS